MPGDRPATILVVEDDPGIAELERGRLAESGHDVLVAGTADEAIAHLRNSRVDLLLLDYLLPGAENGLEFYARIKSAGFDVPVILVTGFGSELTVIEAMRVGVRDFVTKSIQYMDYLPDAVRRVLHQVRTEHRLAESEARLAAVIVSAKDAVIVTEADRTVSLFNSAAERMFGYSANDAIGRRITEFIPDELDQPAYVPDGVDVLTVSHRLRAGTHGMRKGGEPFPLEASVSRGQTNGRQFYTVVVRDISERKRGEAALRASEERLRRIVDTTPDGIWSFDVDGKTTFVNRRMAEMIGYLVDEMMGQSLFTFMKEDAQRYAATKLKLHRQGIAEQHDFQFRRKDGSDLWTIVSITAVFEDEQYAGALAVVTDISERRRLEDQLRQAQKMEAFGQLAGGVAHDFNNLLTIIIGYSELLLGSMHDDNPSQNLLVEIHKAGERSSALTRQLLAFSRQQVLAPRVLNLNHVVSDTDKMLRRLIGEDIGLTTSLGSKLWAVRVDAGQIAQVLLNLAVNARDAMPTGGRLTIETKNVDLNESYVQANQDAIAGPHVLLSVTDTGTGMSPEVQARIFEPFFTTKGVGKGTGLGLATVFGIVKQSGGHLEVKSTVGEGTTFKIYLPRVEQAIEISDSPSRIFTSPRGTETIFLVEDEVAVRALARRILTDCGYTVLEAADGNEANRVAARHEGRIHLLITDVVMPGAGGLTVAENVRERFPQARVLFISGYTDDAVIRYGVYRDQVNFLPKPFTPHSLSMKVREVLDTR